MTSGSSDAAFPSPVVWEEFTKRRVTIEELRERSASVLPRLMLAHFVNEQSPTLDRSAIVELVKTAAGDLDAGVYAQLVRDLTAIGLWYLLPLARTVADADPDATRKRLAVLSQSGKPVFEALYHVLSLLPAQIEERIAADDSFASHSASLNALVVKDFLNNFERLLPQLSELVTAKGPGRPPDFVLRHSANLAATAIQEAGLALVPHHQTFKSKVPYLSGTGADLFHGFFTLLNPRVQPAAFVRALLSARPDTNKNTTKSSPIKVGAPNL